MDHSSLDRVNTVAITPASGTATYDFEPLPPIPCRVPPLPCRVETAAGNVVIGTAAAERISTLGGNDTVDVADGEVDTLDCGPGVDTVVADRADMLRHCENVTRR
jgi:hypothetical protein